MSWLAFPVLAVLVAAMNVFAVADSVLAPDKIAEFSGGNDYRMLLHWYLLGHSLAVIGLLILAFRTTAARLAEHLIPGTDETLHRYLTAVIGFYRLAAAILFAAALVSAPFPSLLLVAVVGYYVFLPAICLGMSLIFAGQGIRLARDRNRPARASMISATISPAALVLLYFCHSPLMAAGFHVGLILKLLITGDL